MKRLLVSSFFIITVSALVFSSCQKELSEESNTNTASYTLLDDSTMACLSTPVVNGHYYNGVSAARDTNFLTVVINVKTTGSYSITSKAIDGFYFSDSGFFSKTGLDTLVLQAKGTPILTGLFDFALSDTTCDFTVEVLDSTGTGLGGVDTTSASIDTSYTDSNPATDSSWHFTDSASGTQYSGIMGKEGNSFIDSDGVFVLTIAGVTTDSLQTFGFQLFTENSTITPGIYPIEDDNSLGFITISSQNIVFISNETLIEDAASYSYIHITSYDATTKHIQGVFHCWALNASAQSVLLKGSFNTYLP